MSAERALGDLRCELHALGVATEDRDVFWTRSGDPMLSLAPGLVVWVGSEWFRWIGERYRWRYHTVGDPAGAARLIRRVYDSPREEPGGEGAAMRR